MNKQLILPFFEKRTYYLDDFISSPANIDALNSVRELANMPHIGYNRILIIYGDNYSGKTYLAKIFAHISGAKFLTESDLCSKSIPDIISEQDYFIIDDIEKVLTCEKQIFHLFNAVVAAGKFLLITTGKKIKDISFKTDDLRSRLISVMTQNILQPDIEFIESLVFKFFSERHFKISHEMIKYFSHRVSRNYEAIYLELNKIYLNAVENKKKVTINNTKPFIGNEEDNL